MTGMTGMTRMTRMTWLQGLYPVLIKKIQGLFKDLSRTNFPFFKDSNHSLEYMSFLVLPQHDCKFNFYPEGLSVFAPFRNLRIWVG